MTVYAYYRVSSEKQRKDRSIESQKFAVAELAERLGVVVNASFEDEAVSGTTDPQERAGYSALATSLRKNDMLLLDSLDRISRDGEELQLNVLLLRKKGVEIHCVKDFDEMVLYDKKLGPAMLGIVATIAVLKIDDVRTKTTNALNRVRKEFAEGKSKKRPGRKANYDPKELCRLLGEGVAPKVVADRLRINIRTVYYWRAELEGHTRNKGTARKELMV